MAVISINDVTLTLNGRVITDFLEEDYLTLTYPNPLTSRVNSMGGVAIQKNINGNVADLVFRVLRNSEDDIFMNNAVNDLTTAVFNGSMKRAYVKDGVESVENIILESGTVTTVPTLTENSTAGNSSMEYTLQFRFATRMA